MQWQPPNGPLPTLPHVPEVLMRLTLRTLLAYMDDILEPADHEDLGKKIEASDFATELIHRSRDTVRRLRLGAPAVLAAGSDDVLDTIDLGDANSVAEYLDNTLPPEQVADFERLCLEQGTKADMHLAEVASCHHVLTMVLGEPAEVDAQLKSRMYQLPAKRANGQKLRIEPAHVAQPVTPSPTPSPAIASSPAPTSVQPASTLAEQELPDYLREAVAAKRRSRRWVLAATLAAVGGLAGYWFASAPPAEAPAEVAMNTESFGGDFEIDIDGLDEMSMSSTETVESTSTPLPSLSGAPATPAAAAETPPPVDATETVETPLLPADQALAATTTPPAPASAAEVTAPVLLDPVPVNNPSVIVADEGSAEPLATVANDVKGLTEEVLEAEGQSAPAMAASAATLPPLPVVETVEPEVTEPVRVAAVASTMTKEMVSTTPSLAEVTEDTAIEPTGPERLGGYLGNTNDVLLIYDTQRDKWIRMPPRSPISTGDVLLTLPKFLTHVVLADVNTYLSGGTRLHVPIEPPAAAMHSPELSLEVVYGRLLLNGPLKGSQVAVQVGEQLREFRMGSSASLAVEVNRVFIPGTDYENEAAAVKAIWYLAEGNLEWPTAAGGTQTVKAPAMWQTIDGIDEIPAGIEKLPAWIGDEPMTDMQRSAREDLAKELEADQPVGIRLLELTEGKGLGRRKEVRLLAAAASVYVGEFEPLVKGLNDSDQKNAWNSHINELRQALALSPDVAARVRQAFIDTRGEEAAQDLMQMVVGYSRSQVGESREAVQQGVLKQLIPWLDHDSLDYRVLAIHNIREITGKSKGYRPDKSSKRRRIDLRKIWDQFEAHELLPRP